MNPIFTLFSRNLRKRSAKMNFLSKRGPHKNATFGVHLSTHELVLHFLPLFSPISRGKKRVFALLLLPDGLKIQGVRGVRFFLGKTWGALRLVGHIWAKHWGHKACSAPFLGGVRVFCSQEEQEEERREEGGGEEEEEEP